MKRKIKKLKNSAYAKDGMLKIKKTKKMNVFF
jgi:hypothetical protein